MTGVKTDYAGHDRRYRRLRADGAIGWASAEIYRDREPELAWALAALAPCGRRLLDLGCGAGNLASWLAAHGFEVTGIDISPTAIAWATERGIPGARFVVGDAVAELSGRYDVVFDGNCLHCIIGADRARLLANVRAALVPDGRFYISTMCGAVTAPALRASFDPVTRCQVVGGVSYRYIGEAETILDELRAAGFEIVASTVRARVDDDDQDHLCAVASIRGPATVTP